MRVSTAVMVAFSALLILACENTRHVATEGMSDPVDQAVLPDEAAADDLVPDVAGEDDLQPEAGPPDDDVIVCGDGRTSYAASPVPEVSDGALAQCATESSTTVPGAYCAQAEVLCEWNGSSTGDVSPACRLLSVDWGTLDDASPAYGRVELYEGSALWGVWTAANFDEVFTGSTQACWMGHSIYTYSYTVTLIP